MGTFKNDFETFALGRIDRAINLEKEHSNEYIKKDNEYSKLLGEFFENLSEEKVILFDQITDVLWTLSGYENLASYRMGINDAYKLQDNNYFSKEEVEE